MVLKLNGADFSANNLGQIEVTTELHPFTEAAILASGNNSLANVQKSALNNLFLAMGVDGSNNVMGKMRKVYLPIIAGDLSKALINYAADNFPSDKNLNSSKWTLRSHGLVGLASGDNITFTESSPLLVDNMSMFWLRTELMQAGVDDSTYVFTLRGVATTSKFLGIRQQSVSSDRYISLGTYGSWGDALPKSGDVIKAYGVTSRNDYYSTNFNQNGAFGSLAARTTPDMSTETTQTLYVFGLSSVQTAKPYAVAMYGEAITKEQAELLCEKIDALWAAFNV